MRKLSVDLLNSVGENIKKYGRALERVIFEKHFEEGNDRRTLDELTAYQNYDGGFGNGIESDFRLPYSSPMATSVGVWHLKELDDLEEVREHIKTAIEYFEASFNVERNGWFALPKEVNLFPHTPWWHFNEEDGMTVIDKNWGNPSAEIIAYLYMYKEYTKELDVDKLVEYAITRIEEKKQFNSEIEIFCYIKLYEVLQKKLQKRLRKRIEEAIAQVIEYDEKKWKEYVPLPLNFVSSPNKERFGVGESKIEANLDFFIDQFEAHEKLLPPWGKSFYKGDLKPAYNEWIGVWTLKALMYLDRFGRIEK